VHFKKEFGILKVRYREPMNGTMGRSTLDEDAGFGE
jgi:hypothetical protein